MALLSKPFDYGISQVADVIKGLIAEKNPFVSEMKID